VKGLPSRQALELAALWAGLEGAVWGFSTAVTPFSVVMPSLIVAAGQWYLLRRRVPWALRWALAVVAGVLVGYIANVIVWPQVARAVPSELAGYVYLVGRTFLGGLVLVVALAPTYGGRTLVWLVSQPALAVGLAIVLPRVTSWVAFELQRPVRALVAASVSGVIEVAVLIWVTRQAVLGSFVIETEPAPEPVREPAPVDEELQALRAELEGGPVAPQPPPAESKGTWHDVAGPLSALFAIALAIAFVTLEGNESGLRPLAVWAILTAPHVAVAAGLCFARSRSLALGVAAGAAGGLALFGAPFLLLTPLFLGFSNSQADFLSGVLTLSLIPLHGVLAFVSYRALKRHAQEGTRAALVATGVVAAALYAPTLPVTLSAVESHFRAEAARKPPPEPGKAAFDALSKCLRDRRAQGSSVQWPTSLDGLGPGGLACLDEAALRPAPPSYQIQWSAPARMAERPAFAACVVANLEDGDRRARLFDADFGEMGGAVKKLSPDSACAQIYADRLRRFRYCLWSYAARRPSYPRTIDDVASCAPPSESDPCVGCLYTYVPGPVDSDGRITTFVLIEGRSRPPKYLTTLRRLDETGSIRETTEERLPAASDPLDERSRPRAIYPEELGLSAVESACNDVGGAACGDLAHLLEQSDLPRAKALHRKLCEEGVAASCVRTANWMHFNAETYYSLERRRLIERACALGLASACRDVVTMEQSRPHLTLADRLQLHTDGCRAGAWVACAQATQMMEDVGLTTPEAATLAERGCELGDQASCMRGSAAYGNGIGVPADAIRADRLRMLACSSAPFPKGCQ
jgi:hypothetical protein